MRSIDLFSGAGGFSIGFNKAGFNTIKAVEFDKTIANTYKKNNSEVKMYIDDIRNIDIENEFSENESDIIIGGPPCQGFSMAGSRIRKDFIDDERNYLFKYYFKIVQKVKATERNGAQIGKLEEENFIKFVTGEQSLDDFDKYVSTWNEQGGSAIINEMQEIVNKQ